VGTFTVDDQGNSNPAMPDGGIYGVKCDTDGDWTVLTWRFTSIRHPVRGDFYAKDGKDSQTTGVICAVWNAGFGLDDVLYPENKIIRPDGSGGGSPPPDYVTPELPSGALLLLGLFPIGIARLRRRK